MRQKVKGPLDKENDVENKMQLFITHCHKKGHLVDKCWTLYPTSHPQHLKKVERDNDNNGKEDSIIDEGQDDSHDDEVQLKEVPLKWFANRCLDFLSN